ncbi:hypothetical protein HZB78_03925 [Candidatus Collierbacteria bacterium]|nr:hypothetical protein [Candidatus Collierbacteria bacterium]
MWQKIKPSITKFVMFCIKKHWLILVAMIGVQYLTGSILAKPWEFSVQLDRGLVLAIHSLGGKLFLITGGLLAVEKIYLYLLKKNKI